MKEIGTIKAGNALIEHDDVRKVIDNLPISSNLKQKNVSDKEEAVRSVEGNDTIRRAIDVLSPARNDMVIEKIHDSGRKIPGALWTNTNMGDTNTRNFGLNCLNWRISHNSMS